MGKFKAFGKPKKTGAIEEIAENVAPQTSNPTEAEKVPSPLHSIYITLTFDAQL
jgi:hypothetical protein